MYRVSWNRWWGTRIPDEWTEKFFTRKPTQDEIIAAFQEDCPTMTKEWFEPRFSGRIVVEKLEVVF